MRKIVTLTSIQHSVWMTVDDLLKKNGIITSTILSDFHCFTHRNSLKYLKLFDREGLLTSYKDKKELIWTRGIEAIVQRRKSVRVTMLSDTWEKLVIIANHRGISKHKLFQWLLKEVTE